MPIQEFIMDARIQYTLQEHALNLLHPYLLVQQAIEPNHAFLH